ncbi:MAG: hypothetical protein MJA82_09425 [Clostridia bacterium]|nr:hypothetical protein [Clostridia bacterium]
MNYKERFFKEIEKRLNELGLKTELIKPVHGYDYISIYASSDKEIGIIYEDGGFNLRHQYQNFFNPINKVTKEVKEYIKAYCNADELDSKGLSQGYKKLLEFNNYVLAMKQMVDERYQFITWVKGATGGVAHGRYFIDYQSAKENMAERCGLIKPKMLNEVELKLIYTNLIYLIKTTPDISYDNEKALGEVLNKIETIVPEIKERQEISEEKEVEPQLEL